jgi:hypothetical protein
MSRQLASTASRPCSGCQPGWMQATGARSDQSASIAGTSRAANAV